MSYGNAVQFLKLLDDKRGMQTQLYVSSPDDLDELVRFGLSKGFIFTKEELVQALQEHPMPELDPVVEER